MAAGAGRPGEGEQHGAGDGESGEERERAIHDV
jgi:hypothetical protein